MDASQNNRKAILLVFAVFLLGIALGGVGTYALVATRVLAARPQPPTLGRDPRGTMARFTHELGLNPDQQKQIEAIFNETRARYGALHERLDPEYEQVRQEGRQKIRQMLTEEQKPKFENLLHRIDEERRERQAASGH